MGHMLLCLVLLLHTIDVLRPNLVPIRQESIEAQHKRVPSTKEPRDLNDHVWRKHLLSLEPPHDCQELVVDFWLVPELELHRVEVVHGIVHREPSGRPIAETGAAGQQGYLLSNTHGGRFDHHVPVNEAQTQRHNCWQLPARVFVDCCVCVSACPKDPEKEQPIDAAQPRDTQNNSTHIDRAPLIHTDARRGMLWDKAAAIARVHVPLVIDLASGPSGSCTWRCGGCCPWRRPALALIVPRHCRTPNQGLEFATSLFPPLIFYPCLSWCVEHTPRPTGSRHRANNTWRGSVLIKTRTEGRRVSRCPFAPQRWVLFVLCVQCLVM